MLVVTVCLTDSYAYDANSESELLKKLNKEKIDSNKLKLLDQLSDLTVDDIERNTYYTNSLLEEAKKQQNTYYICKAYFLHVANAFNKYDFVGVDKWTNLLVPLAKEAKLYDLMFQGKRCAIDILNLKGEYELVSKRAYEMLEEAQHLNSDIGMVLAYQSLGYVHIFTFRYEQATEFIEKAYEISKKLKNSLITSEILERLIELYTIQGDNVKRLNAIRRHDKLAREFNNTSRNEYLLSYLNYLNYYLDTEDLIQAEKYMVLCEKHFSEGLSIYEELYHNACYRYSKMTQNYPRAIAELEILVAISANDLNANRYQFRKAEVLSMMGKHRQALDLYKEIWPIKDSLQVAILHQQAVQLKKDYDADALLLEQKKIDQKTRIALIVLIIIITLVLLLFMLHTLKTQKILGISEKEQRLLNHDMNLSNVAKEHFITNISAAISVPLNSVLEKSSILANDQKLSEAERKIISKNVVETSNELMKLINNILDLSRLEANMMKYNITKVEITSTIRDTIKIINDSGAKVSSQISKLNLIWAKIDNNCFVKILKNIIDNNSKTTDIITIHDHVVNNEILKIIVSGSTLAMQTPPHEIIIINEINSMLLNDFKGKYEVHTDKNEIIITLPIVSIEHV